MTQVFGLLGVKGSGKDTCAKFLVEEHGFVRVAFADKLYREAAQAYGVTVEFLADRTTKESDLPALALANCRDPGFVRAVLAERGWHGSAPADQMHLPLSPRYVLQLWGTEYRRKRGVDSYWLDQVAQLISADPTKSYVITDVRFKNEARFIESLGGKLFRIRRPELEAREAADRALKGTAAHPSETELLNWPVHRELFNVEGHPESLREALLEVLNGCTHPA